MVSYCIYHSLFRFTQRNALQVCLCCSCRSAKLFQLLPLSLHWSPASVCGTGPPCSAICLVLLPMISDLKLEVLVVWNGLGESTLECWGMTLLPWTPCFHACVLFCFHSPSCPFYLPSPANSCSFGRPSEGIISDSFRFPSVWKLD